MQSKKLTIVALFLLANILGFTALAHAGTVVMNFNSEIDQDDDPPAGPPPWVIATFTDNGTDSVLLTIQATVKVEKQSVKRIWFNTASDINADNLTIVQREGGPTATFAGAQQDGFGGTGIRNFDVKFKWNELAFGMNDVVQFDITGSGLTADSFAVLNNDSTYQFFAIAKIGGVDDADNEHGGEDHDELIAPTGIPLPTSLLLGVIGLLTMPIFMLRMKH